MDVSAIYSVDAEKAPSRRRGGGLHTERKIKIRMRVE